MSKKKKITGLLVSLLIISICLGVILAVLVKKTEERTNEFTFGNAQINLVEDHWNIDENNRTVYPNKEIQKDPRVINTGKTSVYAYIEVKVPCENVKTVGSDEKLEDNKWHELFSYYVNSGWELIESNTSDDEKTITKVYAYTKEILEPNETTVTLFDKVKYLNILEGQIEKGTEIDMPINAYAIQSDYLNETGDTVKDMISAYSKYKEEVDRR